ncbi:Protein CBG26968 [Caenorhabditis briggsae]|uniref:Protein CBG26968 n=1 Tax=Caenorhabditis briggsae TaxID=6238 RepID=B6IET4_CAEBR|nr:Protein CBG26968 [Caenorhabditis briggsae]CAR98414.1 Protein CBG26968 [Caenorhabditis briggsae]
MSLGIHGNSSYSDYKASFVTVPVLLLFVPALYIPITIRIVFRIFVNLKVAIREKNANVPLFSAITLSHVMCLLFFFADFMYLRLPLSGLLTSWCASLQPSGYLVILVIIVYHINYIVVILPFLVAVIRLMLVLSPQTPHKINSKVLKWARPIILLYPFIFTFGMFPTVGYCEYPGWPVDFGGVIFRVKHNGVGIQNKYGLLFNTVFWLLASLTINTILILKLVILKSFTQPTVSRASQRAQLSLTITSISMSLTCVTNGMIAVSHQN